MSVIEAFVAASEDGDVQTMSALLPKVDVNTANSEDWTALQKAADAGQLAAARWLVKSAGADVERVRATSGATPLYLACFEGRTDVAQFLLDAGADIDKQNLGGATPLHVACYNDHEEAAQLLVRAGADVNKADDGGATPYDVGRGNATLAKVMLDAGAVSTFNGFTMAAERGDVETMKQFEGVDVNQADGEGLTALQTAASEGQLEVAQWLVNVAGADVERARKNGCTPLYVACEHGKNEVAQFLLDKGADLNQAGDYGASPLYAGAQGGHDAVVESLIVAGADVNKAKDNGVTPLHTGAYHGEEAVVKLLVDAGADLLATDAVEDRTPLQDAEIEGHESVAQLLCDAECRLPVVGALFCASLLVFRTLRRSPLDVIALQRIAEAVAGDELVSMWLTDAERTRIFTASRVTHAVRVARAPQLAALDTVCARMAWLRVSTPAYTREQLEPLGARASRQRDLALAQWRAADAERVAAEQARRVANRRAPPPSARATRSSSRKAAAKRRR